MVKKPAICLISGFSGSGKTTLVEKLLCYLKEKGIAAATAKHRRKKVEVDTPGKDTWRHRRAGAVATFFANGDELVIFRDSPAEGVTPDFLAGLCPEGTALLLVEGWKGESGYPRVEVLRAGETPMLAEGTICIAVEDAAARIEGVTVLHRDDAKAIADLIVKKVLEP
ncbi:molybdopterin-guanine dinucleotide biosynthesis protein B [bacterium]|nr:MAG: molybdopterin-guanine dinucleotide biosynthesis protein B [bacterium]